MQQGHSPSYYRDHPQDIRHRTVQSRRPPPTSTALIKGDPDSATSPSKYESGGQQLPLPDVALVTLTSEHDQQPSSPSAFAHAREQRSPLSGMSLIHGDHETDEALIEAIPDLDGDDIFDQELDNNQNEVVINSSKPVAAPERASADLF